MMHDAPCLRIYSLVLDQKRKDLGNVACFKPFNHFLLWEHESDNICQYLARQMVNIGVRVRV